MTEDGPCLKTCALNGIVSEAVSQHRAGSCKILTWHDAQGRKVLNERHKQSRENLNHYSSEAMNFENACQTK